MTYTNLLQGLQVHKKSGKIFIITQSYDYQFNIAISMINIKEFFKSVYTATFLCVFMGFRYHEKLKKEHCPSINLISI